MLSMSDREKLTLQVTNDLREVVRVVDALHQLCDRHSIATDTASDVSLAVDEVLSNVIRHGRPDEFIEVRIGVTSKAIHVEVEDDGTPFNPITAPMPRFDIPAVDRGPGGLGIYLTKHMMTELSYRRLNGRNILRMSRSIGSPRPNSLS
jgi:anti-sigma regulatory factor (Ser/Thr protein kinase)